MLENLPDGWTHTEHNCRIHIRDKNGNITDRKSPDAHIPWNGK